ncbi:MAG TPA: tannase/feruloyl esterase family alpha/beta hydrolase, partial [Verrucomicrobiae bacterium]|nr:tannase/feruloyl esterase family alpha/beta hydrolase [Verrucomicrobiae bacterium]
MKKALAILVCLVAFASLNSFSAGTNHLTLSALRGIEVPDVNITSVKHVTSEGKKELEGASYVAVEGTIGEHIRFELLLPDAWNGRFAMGGGGGFVGSVQNGARYSVYRGFATVGTDTGHSGNGISASWALDNLEAKVNFGYLAVHRTAEVAKAIIRAYYGKDPEHSYFLGCSRGGGQAMMEAQRYPKDFEGIVAGAPAFSWTGFAAVAVRIAQALYPDPSHLEQNVITRDTLKKLAGAVLEQCDAKDGVKDGIIEDPPSARFDLSKAQGFTDDEKHAIEAIYSGASGPKGKIYPGFAPAAECEP